MKTQQKLSDADARYIWSLVNHREKLRRQLSTLSDKALAQQFGVDTATIRRITAADGVAHA